ncbi:uncharacterized protein LOC115790014 [Archocentrus centrarchus]|uniref:uncharacterized protein LOC115790014 n=1 Tax=Archocentrus centrarchus TaxID=63155 RepID=UPI0011E9E082|nr:uncharacterized protein LOC115790014 [Archocentrus centrarchus]
MTQKNIPNFKRVLLIFLLVNEEETNQPPDESGGESNTFFALRSCHQLLQSESGEFFSPNYLCSNPPLWCNWTIQVDPRKRIHLHLEDLTPDDICNLKQDQIHIDEPAEHLAGHKVLQKCWQEAKYTSSSNILYVVLLIGGWPNPMYRGFYGRYQAFGPPVIYSPGESFQETSEESKASPGQMDFTESGPGTKSEQMGYDYYEQHLAAMTALPWEPEEATDTETRVDEHNHQSFGNHSSVYQFTATPTEPLSTQRTFRSGRGITHIQSNQSDFVQLASPQQSGDSQHYKLRISTRATTAKHRDKEEAAAVGNESRTVTENITEVSQISGQLPSPSERQDPQHTKQTHPQPNMMEPLSDHRGTLNVKNHSETPLFPGDHLFEVAVELNFSQDLEESWDNLARSLLLSVKALISKQLEAVHAHFSVSSKRIKRLHAGVLYILWLQIRQEPGGLRVHRAIHSALQGLISTGINFSGNLREAVIMSVSTADVNECGTQLVLCDINAECVNQFGSYSCRCRPGFQDESRLGSGGTLCVDMKAAGCSSSLSTETKGVYVLFFLLSSLILVLLVVAGMLYHRHHRGKFLHLEQSYSSPADSDLPPPPPPARGPSTLWGHVKEQRQVVDLQLLRFNLLHPPDSYMDQRVGAQ